MASIPYIDRVHQALSENLDGFNKTPEEFKSAMTEPLYAANVHAALGDNLNGFDKTLEEFHNNVVDPNNPITNVPAKQFFADYMQSPIYKQRLAKIGVTNAPDTQNLLNTNISEVHGPGSIAYNKLRTSQTDTKHAGFPIVQGRSNVNIDRGQKKIMDSRYGTDALPDQTMAHELSHVSRELSPIEEELIGSLNNKKDEAEAYKQYKNSGVVDSFSTFLNAAYEGTHDARPSEIKADLDALRYIMKKRGLYDTSKRNMNADDFKKASQDDEVRKSVAFKRLMERYKPTDIIKLNNTIASNFIPIENNAV